MPEYSDDVAKFAMKNCHIPVAGDTLADVFSGTGSSDNHALENELRDKGRILRCQHLKACSATITTEYCCKLS